MQVGYCQGMGFITASFLSYMPEEVSVHTQVCLMRHTVCTNTHAVRLWLQEAFFLLMSCLQYAPHKMAGLYSPHMPKVGLLQFQLQVCKQAVQQG